MFFSFHTKEARQLPSWGIIPAWSIAALLLVQGQVHAQHQHNHIDKTGYIAGRIIAELAGGFLQHLDSSGTVYSDDFSLVYLPVGMKLNVDSNGAHVETIPLDRPNVSNDGGFANNTSRNGTMKVGTLDNGFFTPYRAFYWTDATGPVDLGTLDPTNASNGSVASDVSSNGSVIVGSSGGVNGVEHAFRWTQADGMVDLAPADNQLSRAFGVNGDGSVIVGQHNLPLNGVEAFRWTQATGYQSLGSHTKVATAVTEDGSVIVGQTRLFPPQAFRWTAAGSAQALGALPGHTQSIATGVSDDGSIVVGISSSGFIDKNGLGQYIYDPPTSRAFYWTAATGMQDLNQLLAAAGADMSEVTFVAALGISPDGAWIGGAAITPETESGKTHPIFASLTETLRLPGDFNADGLVDGADYVVWRKNAGGVYTQADFNTWRANFGAGAAAALPGDFNDDGRVDSADYVVWRKNFGSPYTMADFNTWRANFGELSGSGAGNDTARVPEPASAAILLVGLAKLLAGSRAALRNEKT
jgi:probable HAF family extracellular repeat protein